MVIYLHWVAVPLVMVLLSALLVWGMRKDPRNRRRAMAEEIRSDDPPVDHGDGVLPPMASAAGGAIEERRLLTDLWGNDCPDMIVTYWSNAESQATNLSACQQLFLSFQGGMHATLASLENHFFDGALEQGVPERSRFLIGCTFIRLTHRAQDLVIRSTFQGSRFAHEFFLADGDGKLSPLAMDLEGSEDLIFQRHWLEFREAICAIDDDERREMILAHFRARVEEDFSDAQAHSWIAHFEQFPDSATGARHLAMALEFEPDNRLALLESGRRQGTRALRSWIHQARRFLDMRTDFEVQGCFLLAQSLLVLDQKHAARLLCEQMILEFPRHPGTPLLLRQIDQKERGAQT